MEMLIKKLEPILAELEMCILEFNVTGKKPNWSNESFMAQITLFMSGLVDKMYDKEIKNNTDFEQRCKTETKMGNELRDFIMQYTDLDTHKIYANNKT